MRAIAALHWQDKCEDETWRDQFHWKQFRPNEASDSDRDKIVCGSKSRIRTKTIMNRVMSEAHEHGALNISSFVRNWYQFKKCSCFSVLEKAYSYVQFTKKIQFITPKEPLQNSGTAFASTAHAVLPALVIVVIWSYTMVKNPASSQHSKFFFQTWSFQFASSVR